jgi:hypothetical protein
MNPDLAVLHCTLRRVHAPHDWWGRKMQLYFHCPGRTVSLVRRRVRQPKPIVVNEPRSMKGINQ